MSREWRSQLKDLDLAVRAWEQGTANWSPEVNTDKAATMVLQFEPFNYQGFKKDVANFSSRSDKSDWAQLSGYLAASPVAAGDPPFFPVLLLLVRVDKDELQVMLRLAVFYLHSTGGVAADAWRYETADTDLERAGQDFHHFPHVQRVRAWTKGGEGLFPPGSDASASEYQLLRTDRSEVNEIRPAFPISSRTPAGVLIAAMASIYGAERSREMFEPVSLSHELRTELDYMLCLPT